jgi:hypothetical protein
MLEEKRTVLEYWRESLLENFHFEDSEYGKATFQESRFSVWVVDGTG